MKYILITTIAAVLVVGCGPSIHQTVIDGNEALIRRELSNGANVNEKNEDGHTPLHLAAQSGHKRIVELLIDKGSDVNAKNDDGDTPLDVAIKFKHSKIADLLRKHGAKSSESSDHSGNYILEANDIIVPTTLELKPDGSFIGTSSGKMMGSWKVDGDLLVCEASSTKTVIKFNKASGKLNSFSYDGNEMPWKRFLAEEGQDGLYFKKN